MKISKRSARVGSPLFRVSIREACTSDLWMKGIGISTNGFFSVLFMRFEKGKLSTIKANAT